MCREQFAYLAGIIDGEGGIALNGRSIQLYVGSRDEVLVDYLVANFGGRKYVCTPYYKWYANATVLKELAPQVLPFMVIKYRQMEIVTELLSYGNRRDVDREPLRQELQSFSRKGFRAGSNNKSNTPVGV